MERCKRRPADKRVTVHFSLNESTILSLVTMLLKRLKLNNDIDDDNLQFYKMQTQAKNTRRFG